MNFARVWILSFIAASTAFAKNDTLKISGGPEVKVVCESNGKTSLTLLDGDKISVLLLQESDTNYRKGKLKGCQAVEKGVALKVRKIPQNKIKEYKAAQVITVSLPVDMAGNESEEVDDIILLQDLSGRWSFGPKMSTEGAEWSVKYEILSLNSKKIEVNEVMNSEGIKEKKKSIYSVVNGSWKRDSN